MRFVKIVLTSVLMLALVLGVLLYTQWYQWAENGDTPYDEVGIALNGWVPSGMREWACGRIAERFPGSLPPFTCN